MGYPARTYWYQVDLFERQLYLFTSLCLRLGEEEPQCLQRKQSNSSPLSVEREFYPTLFRTKLRTWKAATGS